MKVEDFLIEVQGDAKEWSSLSLMCAAGAMALLGEMPPSMERKLAMQLLTSGLGLVRRIEAATRDVGAQVGERIAACDDGVCECTKVGSEARKSGPRTDN